MSEQEENIKIQGELLKRYAPLVSAYLAEIQSPASINDFLKNLSIAPIQDEDKLIGFWGIRFRESKAGRLATIKAAYIIPELRGERFEKATDDLADMLASKGVMEVEIWAFPQIQEWLTARYGFKPRIYVSQNPLQLFLSKKRTHLPSK